MCVSGACTRLGLSAIQPRCKIASGPSGEMCFCGSRRSFESPLVDVNLKPPCESSFCLPHCCGHSSVVEIFPYFWTSKLYTTALPWHELFTPTSVYGSSSRSASSSTAPPPPPLLLCPTSHPSPRTEPPAPLAPQPPETAGALQPEPADKRHQRKNWQALGQARMTETRVSVAGRRNLRKWTNVVLLLPT